MHRYEAGLYEVTADLSSDQGLTAKGGCIDIKAPNVVLTTGACTDGADCQEFNITGPGGATPTGIGLHVLPSSNNDFIELPSEVSGWDEGLLVEGNNNIVEDFGASNNGTAGVELNGAKNNNINDFTAYYNNNYGVWLRHSSKNQINCNGTDYNGNIGLYVGCAAKGPVSAKCKGIGPSNGNRLYDSTYQENTKYGLVIDLGNEGNTVIDTQNASNGTLDDVDENPNCGKNQWVFNSFGTSNASCIQ